MPLSTFTRPAATALALTVAVALGSAPAQADSVWLAGGGGTKYSYSYNLPGNQHLTVTASNIKNNAYTVAKVGRYSNGMGVTNQTSGDAHFLDGYGSDDILWFTFKQTVVLKGFKFSYVDSNDDAKLINPDYDTLQRFDVKSTVNFKDGYVGKKFGLMAYGSNDEYKAKKIIFHTIPSPSAAAAGLFGIAALALRRRRRRN